jgi:hypothetical protein
MFILKRALILIFINFLGTFFDEILAKKELYLTVMWPLGVDIFLCTLLILFIDRLLLGLKLKLVEKKNYRIINSYDVIDTMESNTCGISPIFASHDEIHGFISKWGFVILWFLGLSLAFLSYLINPKPTSENLNDATNGNFKVWQVVIYVSSLAKNSIISVFGRYPFLPWLSMTLWGAAYGKLVSRSFHFNASSSCRWHLFFFSLFLCFFLLVRLFGKFGNYWPSSTHPSYIQSLKYFLTIVKYPPSLAYISLNMAFVHLSLSFYDFLHALSQRSRKKAEVAKHCENESRIDDDDNDENEPLIVNDSQHNSLQEVSKVEKYIHMAAYPLLVFGNSALFFYVTHFVFFKIVGLVIKNLFPLLFPGQGYEKGVGIPGIFISWICVLFVLFFLCQKYGNFKRKKSVDSLWRFF